MKFQKYSYNVVKEMGYETTEEVYDNGLWKEYRDNSKEEMKRDLGIDYVGKIYIFGFSYDYVRNVLVHLEEIEAKQLD